MSLLPIFYAWVTVHIVVSMGNEELRAHWGDLDWKAKRQYFISKGWSRDRSKTNASPSRQRCWQTFLRTTSRQIPPRRPPRASCCWRCRRSRQLGHRTRWCGAEDAAPASGQSVGATAAFVHLPPPPRFCGSELIGGRGAICERVGVSLRVTVFSSLLKMMPVVVRTPLIENLCAHRSGGAWNQVTLENIFNL